MKKITFCILFAALFLMISSAQALMIKIENVNPIQPGIPTQIQNSFDINVMLLDVGDLGAFEFDIKYDPTILTARNSIIFGSFLGSTGRIATELLPDIDNNAGRLTVGAFSQGTDAGPNGTGILATVTFDLKKMGDSRLWLEAVQITDTGGDVLTPTTTDGQIVPRYHISTAAGSGGGISPSGDVLVKPGENQSFSIQPSACYHITDVKADGVSKGTVSQHTFTNVNENHTIQAFFEINSFIISVSSGTGGSISPSGNVTLLCGQHQKFTITPDQGYRIKDVKADGVSQGRISEYTFSGVNSNHMIYVEFYPAVQGDIDGNDAADLRDTILALQILCDIEIGNQKIFIDADANGDGKIGIEDVVLMLQKIAEMR